MKNTDPPEGTRPAPTGVAPLLELSARLGADPMLSQAANGNTSIKIGGTLWIKATGKSLARATQEETFVPVDLAAIREASRTNTDITQVWTSPSGLRPSTETPMHAVLKHNVVLHLHSINCIAWAVRLDGPVRLIERLAGLQWQWIPYIASGLPVAREVKKRMANAPGTDVWILGNHGLAICGDDCAAVEALLKDVERRLAVAPRRLTSLETTLLDLSMRSSSWRCPDLPDLHTLGVDPDSCQMLKGGCLYPSQAIFLGSKLRTLPRFPPLSQLSDYANGRDGAKSFVIVEGGGVIVSQEISRAEEATLVGLAQVLQRIEANAPLRYLTPGEIANLTGD